MRVPSVTIDASVLAVPSNVSSADAVHEYVDSLLDWQVLLNEPWVAIYMSERAAEGLFEKELYPLRDHLRQLFAAHGVTEYDVNTVARVADQLLQTTPSFETYFKVKDVLFEQLSTTPDILQFCTSQGLHSDLARCIVLIAILRNHCSTAVRDHSLILRDACTPTVTVEALVHCLECEREDVEELPSPPDFFRGDVLVCKDFRGLIDCLEASAILLSSSDDVGIETAIRVALYKARLGRGEEPEWTETGRMRLGAEFSQHLRKCCADADSSFPSRALRAIVEAIDQQNLRAIHALRESPAGNSPQRTRGRDRAWRRDIDREYHLHYWECGDGSIELASVGVHNEFAIPE